MVSHQLDQGALKGPVFVCDSLDTWLPWEMIQSLAADWRKCQLLCSSSSTSITALSQDIPA